MMIYYDTFDRLVKGKKLILFGAGSLGIKVVLQYLKNYEVSYFCDNDSKKWGTEIMNIPVCSPEKLQEEDMLDTVVLITSLYKTEVETQLNLWMGVPTVSLDIFNLPNETAIHLKSYLIARYHELNCQKDKMEKVYDLLSDSRSKEIWDQLPQNYKTGNLYFGNVYTDKMYFNEIFADSIAEDEVYVDGGVLDGGTILQFIEFSKHHYSKIYGFEPDTQAYAQTHARLFQNTLNNIELHNIALSDFNGKARFANSTHGGSSLNEAGSHLVSVAKLDDILNEKVTFIKLDIEGAEYEALIGAKRIIQTHKPKLAICVYHRHDDFWRIPLLIHEMVPEYKFYIRHHSLGLYETVLYAKI